MDSVLASHNLLDPRQDPFFNRRSTSIFSRRGTETPVPNVKPINMQPISTSPSRSRRWRIKRKPSSDTSKSTILRAVPQEPLSPLNIAYHPSERNLAPSPNTEILNTITKSSQAPAVPATGYIPQTHFRSASSPADSPSPRNSPDMRQEEEARRIGIWKNGRAHWNSKPAITIIAQPGDAFDVSPIEPSSNRIPPPSSTGPPFKGSRPQIQVVIPEGQRNRPSLPRKPVVQPPVQTVAYPAMQSAAPVPRSVQSQRVPNVSAWEKIRSAEAEVVYGKEASPPSAHQNFKGRYSLVSPLSVSTYNQPKANRSHAFKKPSLSSIAQEQDRSKASHRSRPSLSHSSASSNSDDDDASCYSKRSSMTSVEDNDGSKADEIPIAVNSERNSVAYSLVSPVAAGVFETEGSLVRRDSTAMYVTVQQSRSHKQSQSVDAPQPLSRVRSKQSKPLRQQSGGIVRRSSTRRERARQSITLVHIHEALARMDTRDCPSPTLSEAEKDLHKQLTAITPGAATDDDWFEWEQPILPGSVPSLPQKSERRRHRTVPANLVPPPLPSRTPTPNSAVSFEAKLKGLKLTIPTNNRPKPVESKAPTPVVAPEIRRPEPRRPEPRRPEPRRPEPRIVAEPSVEEHNFSAEAAEVVILSIMERLASFDDLFSAAMASKGFYHVFKRHELALMKAVLRNMSAPAWEHREICPPYSADAEPDSAAPKPEYTATSYLRFYQRDSYIIAALKSLILDRCQSFLRSETAAALASHDHVHQSRTDDALWRIWTFCKIFGSGKGREDDVVGQMDWLRGGPLFHQKGCRATIMTHESFDLACVLANAPDSFARGNPGGLTAEQLYDMTELWNCLSVLLQGLQGRTEQAKAYGVFDNAGVTANDVEGQEVMLEEWHYYLLTLGLSTTLDLATSARLHASDPTLFIKAADKGWTNWSPPSYGGSRNSFLKEAVSRVYEERISATFSNTPEHRAVKELNRQRINSHIGEIRRRKISGDFREVTMSMERPMSQWEDALNALTTSNGAPAIPPTLLEHPADSSSLAPIHAIHPYHRRKNGSQSTTSTRSSSASTANSSTLHSAHSSISSTTTTSYSSPSSSPPQPQPRHHPHHQHRQHHQRYRNPSSAPLAPPPAPPTSHPPQPKTRPPPPPPLRASHPSFRAVPVFAQPSLSQHPAFRNPATAQHPLQRDIIHNENLAENTADKAIFRIVEMGFTAEQARHALRVTDQGDGLRVDRAVELLLRNT